MRKIIFAGLCALFLWSCASGPNDYTYQDMGQAAAVRQGTVLSIRPVKVSSQSGVGQIGGAVAGRGGGRRRFGIYDRRQYGCEYCRRGRRRDFGRLLRERNGKSNYEGHRL